MEEFKITRLGLSGDGIAQTEGGDIYLPLTLPGERVAADITNGKPVGRVRILEPVAERVSAPCTHFGRCGGCALQHASDSLVADWKEDAVRRALAAHGIEAPFRPQAISPPGSRRRATFSGRRTKKAAQIGFHARGDALIVEVPDCAVITPGLRAVLPALEALVMTGGSRKGEVKFTVTDTDEGPDVSVTEAKPVEGQMLAELVALAHRFGLSRLTWNGDVLATLRPPALRLGAASVVPPPGAFLQATAEGQEALTAAALEAVADAGRVLDLFSGVGTFTLPLAKRAEVHAVESDATMLTALDTAWRATPGLKRVTTEARDLFRRPLLAGEFKGWDAAVIDPPRAGAQAQMGPLAEAGPARLAMISCNPVTFARDMAMLRGAGYRLDWVQVVDQFRWSPHVEIASALVRE
ncbi:23S rRNA (uracil1939-C5)-methyltransferase [Rubricella aquisinus]|uniref:23S rRNA (Uracil1939-C5)-methyltransferase n=1 Tax=Rubricella aquisinus TaxID=2028108 RepID=A0A840WNJ6_9RHOB|nr:class I SAM-dependent RNA methyltransferase [Rubricella aquisinus]MBB5515663.1 23S rRNA (uracil1939-C5)-methyltransferase [Rubricella aquisinus]